MIFRTLKFNDIHDDGVKSLKTDAEGHFLKLLIYRNFIDREENEFEQVGHSEINQLMNQSMYQVGIRSIGFFGSDGGGSGSRRTGSRSSSRSRAVDDQLGFD